MITRSKAAAKIKSSTSEPEIENKMFNSITLNQENIPSEADLINQKEIVVLVPDKQFNKSETNNNTDHQIDVPSSAILVQPFVVDKENIQSSISESSSAILDAKSVQTIMIIEDKENNNKQSSISESYRNESPIYDENKNKSNQSPKYQSANNQSTISESQSILKLIEKISDLDNKVDEFNKERSKLHQDIGRLKRKVVSLETYNSVFSESLTAIEKEITLLAQYGRRESIEILGISENVGIDHLEEEVLKILNNIGVFINSYDIVAVHRLNDKKYRSANSPPSAIVRFVNRKHAFETLSKKRNLKSCGMNNLFIIENLCPVFKSLYEKCKKLKKDNTVNHVWTHNGTINIRYSDSRYEKPIQILHEEDYDYYFPEELDICQWSEDEDKSYN